MKNLKMCANKYLCKYEYCNNNFTTVNTKFIYQKKYFIFYCLDILLFNSCIDS